MNVIVSGHRIQKLENYDKQWIKNTLFSLLESLKENFYIRGYSGMASGVDLWFLDACYQLDVDIVACPPFEGQENTMDDSSKIIREEFLSIAKEIKYIKNSKMVELADMAIVVFDGNKGGTHNVFQQLIENKKNFYWINPVAKVIWKCFNEDEDFEMIGKN